jgi:histone H3/H4
MNLEKKSLVNLITTVIYWISIDTRRRTVTVEDVEYACRSVYPISMKKSLTSSSAFSQRELIGIIALIGNELYPSSTFRWKRDAIRYLHAYLHHVLEKIRDNCRLMMNDALENDPSNPPDPSMTLAMVLKMMRL